RRDGMEAERILNSLDENAKGRITNPSYENKSTACYRIRGEAARIMASTRVDREAGVRTWNSCRRHPGVGRRRPERSWDSRPLRDKTVPECRDQAAADGA